MVAPPSLSLMPRRASIRPISTRAPGIARRSFIAGIREWPPASTFASGFPARIATASWTDDGRWYSNCVGYTSTPLRESFRAIPRILRRLHCPPHPFRREGHIDVLDPEVLDGIDDRVRHGWC